ncbi:MAG: glycosyltransferase, partial [Paracoccaceae bacterium]
MSRSPRKAIVQALTKVWSTRRFIADRDLAGWLRLRNAPPQTFSMVVAIYKVEDYLDDFVRSVLRQRGGLKQLEVIFVNDGSPDRSGEIAKAWAARRPDVFRYIEQENQGVAAARNAGLRIATGDWVGFPDPDDFFSRNYLLEARIAAMRGGEKLAAITANFVFFWEAARAFKNTHPLRYRFVDGRRNVPLGAMDGYIQLSGSHGWLNRHLIEKSGVRFDSKVMPSFEDAHFVNQFFLSVPDREIAVIPGATYYYRKRAVEGSALDKSKTDRRWFND